MSDIIELLSKQPCSPEYDSFVDELDAAGWQLVPKEATDEMIMAGWRDGRPGSMWETYRRMLKAAPKISG